MNLVLRPENINLWKLKPREKKYYCLINPRASWSLPIIVFTMCSSVNPVITKVHSNCSNVPSRWRVPWKFINSPFLIDFHVKVILNSSENNSDNQQIMINTTIFVDFDGKPYDLLLTSKIHSVRKWSNCIVQPRSSFVLIQLDEIF